MKRRAQCYGTLDLGVRFRNWRNGGWWVNLRFCPSYCETLYDSARREPAQCPGPRLRGEKCASPRTKSSSPLNPALAEEVETLAREIADGKASRELLERARQVAEAQIDLRRVQYARYQLLSGGLEDPPYEPPIANSKPQGQHKSAAILSQELKKWLAMDWYERRALSRRKRAIRDFDEARRQAVAPGGTA